ncbi:MAG: S-layer homology domain-containing protein [Saccharofermentans sp.]|nr:S-layer homology domain-containing protein [Saccharofermentans sp.]
MNNRFAKFISILMIASFVLTAAPFIPGRDSNIKAVVRADGTITARFDPSDPRTNAEPDSYNESDSNIDKAGLTLRKAIKEFKTNVSITLDKPIYAPTLSDVEAIFEKIKDKALAHTGKPDEGDYLLWTLSYIDFMAAGAGDYFANFSFAMRYHVTKSQSSQATKKADTIVSSLKLSGKSDYDKIKAIYGYVTKNVKYDYYAADNDGVAHSMYGALCKNEAVCQGIALAVYYMVLKAGIDCRLVSGDLVGERHGWNLVKLNGKYYYVDATNDLGKKSYSYFLRGGNSMPRHTPDPAFRTASFKKKYPLATADYGAKVTPTPTSKPTATPTPTKVPLPTPKNVEYTMTDKGSLTVVSGDRVFLHIPVTSFNYTKWTSTNPDVYEEDGACIAKKAGKTTVTVTYTDMTNIDADGNFPQDTKSVDITVLYKDVTKQSEFWYTPTNYLTAAGVVKGYDNQTLFKPANDCTRAQMLTFMWRLAGSPNPKNNKCTFTDVDQKEYYYKPVLWAVEKGITTGYDDNTFRPQTVCTRAQTVTFLWRMAGKPNPGSTAGKFSDVKTTDYFYKATLWASEMKILAGYDDGTFRPKGECLRRQMVTFLYKYDKYVNNR